MAEPNSRVVFISLSTEPKINRRYSALKARIYQIASMEFAHMPILAMDVLTDSPKVLFIMDEAIATQEHAPLWGPIFLHIRNGGTAIFMGNFNC